VHAGPALFQPSPVVADDSFGLRGDYPLQKLAGHQRNDWHLKKYLKKQIKA
jgi:hypothetical protein